MNAVATKTAENLGASVSDLGGGILAVIERAVRDPSVDIEKMERLLAMQERVTAENARREFNSSLRAAKSEARPVLRNKVNDQTRSRYSDLEAVSEAIDPIFDKHGFAFTFGTGKADIDNHYRITCDLLHVGGHERPYYADVPMDMAGIKGNQNKTATHGFGSTMSYGRRYLKMLIADVSTTDDDGKAAGSEYVTEEQWRQLQDMVDSVQADVQRFCQFMNVGSLKEILARDFQKAMKALEAKRKP